MATMVEKHIESTKDVLQIRRSRFHGVCSKYSILLERFLNGPLTLLVRPTSTPAIMQQMPRREQATGSNSSL